jgi:hypothetical protein
MSLMSGLGDELAEAVSGADALAHLHELQRIADAHAGNRAPGTAGYSASVAYVTEVLAAAGYQVTTQDVPYARFVVTSESTWLTEGDWAPRTLLMDDSPPLPDTVARLIILDETDGLPPASADLRGAVVLLARIPGGYAKQVMAAAEAGAVAMLFYTDTPCPANIYRLHWFGAGPPPIPVASISQDDAGRLAALTGAGLDRQAPMEVRLDWRGRNRNGIDQSVFASTGDGDTAGVVVGAHLDSVPEAPGINDNGSGVAAVLQAAIRLASARGSVTRPVTFALWAAEELVNVGSTYYVSQLADAQRRATALYLNAEMIASPNYVPYVMRGEGTVTTPFDTYFQARGIGYEYIDVTAIGSDHHPFREAGIPVGGLHCGSVGIKTPAEQARYRGTAGQLYDPGYHQPADSVHNISPKVLDLTTRALAYAVGWAAQG